MFLLSKESCKIDRDSFEVQFGSPRDIKKGKVIAVIKGKCIVSLGKSTFTAKVFNSKIEVGSSVLFTKSGDSYYILERKEVGKLPKKEVYING